MPSIFEKNNHKASRSSSLIRNTSGIAYGDDVDVLPTPFTSPRGKTWKSRQTSGVSTSGRFGPTIMSISSITMGSNNSASDSPHSHRPPVGIADLVLHPDYYTTLLFQASVIRDPGDDRPPTPTGIDPETDMHSKETSLDVPRPTPSSHDSICMDVPPAVFVNGVNEANALMESITYDVILAPTLLKSLGKKYWDIPATRIPLNSSAAIQEDGFGSLMCASMAIMQRT